MNNEGFISSLHVFDLLIHDLIKPRKFNCVAAVSRGISSALPRNLPNSPRNLSNFPRKTVGPNDELCNIVCPERNTIGLPLPCLAYPSPGRDSFKPEGDVLTILIECLV